MDQSNTIAQDIEMHGVCTFSAKDMAFNMVPATSVIVYHHLLRVYPSRYLDVSSFSCKSMHPPSIRHPRPHPLTNLQTTLTANLQQIWDALVKPPELQGLQVDRLQPFLPGTPTPTQDSCISKSDVQTLSGQFTVDFVFKPAYHKHISADGVAFYMEGIWDGTFRVISHVR